MSNTMRAVRLHAEWAPKPGFKLGAKDIEGRQSYLVPRSGATPILRSKMFPFPNPAPVKC